MSSEGDWEAESERYLREVKEEFDAYRRASGAGGASGQGS